MAYTLSYFEMDYTDGSGRNSPQSVWFLKSVEGLDVDRKVGALTFKGYNTLTDLALGKLPIEIKTYFLTPATWDAFFTATGLRLTDVFAPCYDFALLVKDVGTPPEEGAPDTRVSFFENAELKTLDMP